MKRKKKTINLSDAPVLAPIHAVYVWNHNLCAVRLEKYFVRETLQYHTKDNQESVLYTRLLFAALAQWNFV